MKASAKAALVDDGAEKGLLVRTCDEKGRKACAEECQTLIRRHQERDEDKQSRCKGLGNEI